MSCWKKCSAFPSCLEWLVGYKGSGGLIDKVSASQPGDRGFESNMGHYGLTMIPHMTSVLASFRKQILE